MYWHAGIDRRETKLGKLTEVILPGTSYNPDSQQHQDALALAVAVEVRQALDKELQPTPPKRHVDDAPTGADEVEQLQVTISDRAIDMRLQLDGDAAKQ